MFTPPLAGPRRGILPPRWPAIGGQTHRGGGARALLRLGIVRIGRVHVAWAPVGRITIVPIHVSVIAPLAHIPVDQIGVVGWCTGDVLARLVDIDRVITDPGDRVHWQEKLRLPQAQEAPGRNLEKADPPVMLVDQ